MTNLEKLIKLNEKLSEPYILKKLSKDNYFLGSKNYIKYKGINTNVFSSKNIKDWRPCVRTFNQAFTILKLKNLIEKKKNFLLKITYYSYQLYRNDILIIEMNENNIFYKQYSGVTCDYIKFRLNINEAINCIFNKDIKKIEVVKKCMA